MLVSPVSASGRSNLGKGKWELSDMVVGLLAESRAVVLCAMAWWDRKKLEVALLVEVVSLLCK